MFETVPTGAPLNPFGIAVDSHTLLFTWEEPMEELRNGIIRQYHINFTEVETERQMQAVSTTTTISLSSLHPYYTYHWAVSAFTVSRGPFTESQTIVTPEDGRNPVVTFKQMFHFVCAYITAPSGSPQMLTVVETGVINITLSWQNPLQEDRNGVILGFVVKLSSVSTRESRELTTVYTSITVVSLTPYTLYECVVAAYTSVGTGPFSSIILARTEPSSNYLCYLCLI